jgi:uncharacterized damage-inducible protein DinB
MNADWLLSVIDRDLVSLGEQLSAYQREEDIWKLVPGVSNSPGTLALHAAGNIQHFIGALLGGTGYVRDREAEFSRREVPRSELLAELAAARSALNAGLSGLGEERLAAGYPQAFGGTTQTTGQFIVHLATHLAFHLGQVDYHRRILTGAAALPGMVSPRALGTQAGGGQEG